MPPRKKNHPTPQNPLSDIPSWISNTPNPESQLVVSPSQISDEAYAVLVLAQRLDSDIIRLASNRFKFVPRSSGDTFVYDISNGFRPTYRKIVTALIGSPARRKEMFVRGEQIAVECLRVAKSDLIESRRGRALQADHSQNNTESDQQLLPEILSVSPYKARVSQSEMGATVRDSSAILEVRWSDGSTTFKCAFCTFEKDSFRSIIPHVRIHSEEERVAAASKSSKHFVPGLSWEPTQRQSGAIARLSNEISAAMASGFLTPDDIARAIIRHRIESSGESENDPRYPSKAMSAEDQIKAIRQILGTDDEAREVKQRQESELQSLRAEIGSLNSQVASAQSLFQIAENERDTAVQESLEERNLRASLESRIELALQGDTFSAVAANIEKLAAEFSERSTK